MPEPENPAPVARVRALKTGRKAEVLVCLARGMNSDEIAEELNLQPRTVREYKKYVYEDLRAHTSGQAVANGIAAGWITIGNAPPPRQQGATLTAFGETKTVTAWARDPRCAVGRPTLYWRVKSGKFGPEEALTTPAEEANAVRAAAKIKRSRGEASRELIRELVERGAPSLAAVGQELGITPQSVFHHLSRMRDGEQIKAQMRENRRPHWAKHAGAGGARAT